MRDFISQVRATLDANLYYLALFATLAIPDICGAIESQDGEASRKKYKQWFDKYVAHKYAPSLTSEDCYYFRCSLLHQGSSKHHRSSYSRFVFTEPNPQGNIIHLNIIEDALNLDIAIFCNDIITGAEQWLLEHEGTPLYEKNYSKFMRRYPTGLAPYIVGTPVIS